MKIPSFQPLKTEGLPKELKSIKTILDSINKALVDHTYALQRRLLFADNFDCEVRDIEVLHGTAVEVDLSTMRSSPRGVLLMWSELHDFAKLKWEQSGTKKIKVTVEWDSTPTAFYTVRILVIGG